MIFFNLLLLPVALFIYFAVSGQKKFFTVAATGFFVGMLVCGVRFVFFYSHRLVPDSFVLNYLFYLTRLVILPMIVYVVFVLISKDTSEFKIKSFFPLMTSFAVVYYPYYFLTMSGSVYNGYDLFFRPVIYLAMLAGFSYALNMIYNSVVNKEAAAKIKYIIIAAVMLLFPALIDTAYLINKFFWLFTILGIAYSAVILGYAAISFIKNNK